MSSSPSKQPKKYSVKIIDPKRKSKWTTRVWHDAIEEFRSPTVLKAKLAESFPEDLPDNLNFQVGYFQGKSGGKRCIIESRDLEQMYSIFKEGAEVHLWCEGNIEPDDPEPVKKRSKTSTGTRRELFEDELDEIYEKLREKHQENFTGPQLRLWARMLRSGRYSDYDNAPQVPLITGMPATKPKESMKDAFTGAATAVVKMIQSGNSAEKGACTPASKSTPTTYMISPIKNSQLRRSCLEDLKKVKELYEESV